MELLQEFDLDLEYINDKEIVVVDTLYRQPTENPISCFKSPLIKKIKTHYANDHAFKLPIKNLSKVSTSIKEIEKFKSYELRNKE